MEIEFFFSKLFIESEKTLVSLDLEDEDFERRLDPNPEVRSPTTVEKIKTIKEPIKGGLALSFWTKTLTMGMAIFESSKNKVVFSRIGDVYMASEIAVLPS
ncbi:hypothetical protein HAX54_019956 [Datura stramonium]|uniref:Uncharacterized protein n=1 Tax=Datura stramonium TaxID=4076 RepID=A0ABS8UQ15_DATST|nr:hypothetical protein [Datura stramonium]